jgi:hypothetical protein
LRGIAASIPDQLGLEESMAASDESLLGAVQQKGSVHDDYDRDDQIENLKSSLAHVTDVWRSKTGGRPMMAWVQESEYRRAPWRKNLAETLESTSTHCIIVGLLLVDLLATAIDILKTIHDKSDDLNSCVSLVEVCSCVEHFERTEEWKWTYWIGIIILIILLLNILGLLLAFGFSFFFHPGYVLDLVVVTTALLLEIFLDAETAGLLVILSIWRIVRVAHGIFEVTDEAWEEDIHKLQDQIQKVQDDHQKDLQVLQEKSQRIAELEAKVFDS